MDAIMRLEQMGGIWAVLCFLVVVAIGIDLVSGWRKATIRGEQHTSYALSRTITKLLLYEGSMVVMGCIDVAIMLCHITDVLGAEMIRDVPFMSGIACIFICLVEMRSIYEKASDKSRKRIKDAAEMLAHVLSKDGKLAGVADILDGKKEKDGNTKDNSSED